MMSNRTFIFILSTCSVLMFSCRKEKLKDTEEKLLIGTWEIYATYTGYSWGIANDQSKLIINRKGIFTYIKNPEGIETKYRVARLKLVNDPYNQPPQVSYLFEANIYKKGIFSGSDEWEGYKYIRYVNGYFDDLGNFLQQDRMHLMKGIDFLTERDRVFIKK